MGKEEDDIQDALNWIRYAQNVMNEMPNYPSDVGYEVNKAMDEHLKKVHQTIERILAQEFDKLTKC